MVVFLTQYFSENWMNVVVDITIGIIVTLLFAQKNPKSIITNHTSIRQASEHIIETIIIKETTYPSTKRKYKRQPNDNSGMYLMLFLGALVIFFFIKYYSIILNIYASIILITLISTLGIAIKLYINNQYNHLNRFWTILLLVITAYNIWHLKIMSQLDLSNIVVDSFITMLESAGMDKVISFSYHALGFIVGLLPNIIGILLLIHILALNTFLLKGGKLSRWTVKKTLFFTRKPFNLVIIVICMIALALFLSSGQAFEFIKDISNVSFNQ